MKINKFLIISLQQIFTNNFLLQTIKKKKKIGNSTNPQRKSILKRGFSCIHIKHYRRDVSPTEVRAGEAKNKERLQLRAGEVYAGEMNAR